MKHSISNFTATLFIKSFASVTSKVVFYNKNCIGKILPVHLDSRILALKTFHIRSFMWGQIFPYHSEYFTPCRKSRTTFLFYRIYRQNNQRKNNI